jgi:hypothetical protein
MWPFKTKSPAGGYVAAEIPGTALSTWSADKERADALRAWREVGQEFEYLGRRMVVAAHERIEYHGLNIRFVPELKARYTDNNGMVHTLVFSEAEALALAFEHLSRPIAYATTGVDVGADRMSVTFPPEPLRRPEDQP